ncbi:MAG: helix-turn-helix transcriptional regulator [Candidatus Daviesbacteria bacterium]|nr:helix-turn-helix transcriptional regulator [Candidatus Daviesbacteria bacterium]
MASLRKLGEKIRKLRKDKDLTQEKLAELADVDPKTIIEIEHAKRKNPTLKTLNKIAKVFGNTSSDLLSS